MRHPGAIPAQIAQAIANETVEVIFRGRKGHGGGPISRRVLWPNELREIVRTAVLAGLKLGKEMK